MQVFNFKSFLKPPAQFTKKYASILLASIVGDLSNFDDQTGYTQFYHQNWSVNNQMSYLKLQRIHWYSSEMKKKDKREMIKYSCKCSPCIDTHPISAHTRCHNTWLVEGSTN